MVVCGVQVKGEPRLPRLEEGDAAFEEALPLLFEGLCRALRRRGLARARRAGMSMREYMELVDEVTWETLCAARLRVDGWDPGRGPLTLWLFLLGRDRLQRELRAQERWSRGLRALEEEALVAPPSPQRREMAALVERDRLGQAMRELPEEQARALALFHLWELSLEEVGAVMGRTPEAVSSLLQRARRNARERLEGLPRRKRGRPPGSGRRTLS